MELSFTEIIFVLVIALLVFGPEEMVKKSRQMGAWIGKIKSEMNNFRVLAEEALLDRVQKKELKQLSESLSGKIDINDLNEPLEKLKTINTDKEIESSLLELAKKTDKK